MFHAISQVYIYLWCWEIFVLFSVFRIKDYRAFCYFTRFAIYKRTHFNTQTNNLGRFKLFQVSSRARCLCYAYIRPSIEEIAEVHGTFARCCLWTWQIFPRHVYFVSRLSRIETSFFPRGARACNFLESLRISSHSPTSANHAGHSTGVW